MNKGGPIVIIEDDQDDIDIYHTIFSELQISNELIIFTDGDKALAYLRELDIKPFLILSDVNLPKQNGFEIREIINADPELYKKCIPYILFTTDTTPNAIEKAYMLSVQGIFQKPTNFERWKQLIKNILEYWTDCMSPK